MNGQFKVGFVSCVKEGKFVFEVNYRIVKCIETGYVSFSSTYGIFLMISYMLSHKANLRSKSHYVLFF